MISKKKCTFTTSTSRARFFWFWHFPECRHFYEQPARNIYTV